MSSAAAGWLQAGLLVVALAACYVPLGIGSSVPCDYCCITTPLVDHKTIQLLKNEIKSFVRAREDQSM